MRIEDSLIFLVSLDWVKIRCLTGLILRDTFPMRSDSAKAANRNPGQNVFGEVRPICGGLGYKRSGNGREYGVYGFEEYLETKAIIGFGGSLDTPSGT
jgi:hypothetical protein